VLAKVLHLSAFYATKFLDTEPARKENGREACDQKIQLMRLQLLRTMLADPTSLAQELLTLHTDMLEAETALHLLCAPQGPGLSRDPSYADWADYNPSSLTTFLVSGCRSFEYTVSLMGLVEPHTLPALICALPKALQQKSTAPLSPKSTPRKRSTSEKEITPIPFPYTKSQVARVAQDFLAGTLTITSNLERSESFGFKSSAPSGLARDFQTLGLVGSLVGVQAQKAAERCLVSLQYHTQAPTPDEDDASYLSTASQILTDAVGPYPTTTKDFEAWKAKVVPWLTSHLQLLNAAHLENLSAKKLLGLEPATQKYVKGLLK